MTDQSTWQRFNIFSMSAFIDADRPEFFRVLHHDDYGTVSTTGSRWLAVHASGHIVGSYASYQEATQALSSHHERHR